MTNDELVRLKALCAAATPEITLPVGYNPDGTPASLFYDAARTAMPLLIAEIERMRPTFEAACAWRDAWEPYHRAADRLAANTKLEAAVDASRAKESKY